MRDKDFLRFQLWFLWTNGNPAWALRLTTEFPLHEPWLLPEGLFSLTSTKELIRVDEAGQFFWGTDAELASWVTNNTNRATGSAKVGQCTGPYGSAANTNRYCEFQGYEGQVFVSGQKHGSPKALGASEESTRTKLGGCKGEGVHVVSCDGSAGMGQLGKTTKTGLGKRKRLESQSDEAEQLVGLNFPPKKFVLERPTAHVYIVPNKYPVDLVKLLASHDAIMKRWRNGGWKVARKKHKKHKTRSDKHKEHKKYKKPKERRKELTKRRPYKERATQKWNPVLYKKAMDERWEQKKDTLLRSAH
jgi:hypothetical protein